TFDLVEFIEEMVEGKKSAAGALLYEWSAAVAEAQGGWRVDDSNLDRPVVVVYGESREGNLVRPDMIAFAGKYSSLGNLTLQ
ncbi:hypothetical protein GUF51_04840, partial [Xanthomonas citri pv. citri]|nr:hypothetical protein [Xanthomonas citri pv. citri]